MAATVNAIGTIKNVNGAVEIVRGTNLMKASYGLTLLENDVIVTGKIGSTLVALKDNSVLSIGSDSRIELEEIVLNPADGQTSFRAYWLWGMNCLTRVIYRLKPSSDELRNPYYSLGIR